MTHERRAGDILPGVPGLPDMSISSMAARSRLLSNMKVFYDRHHHFRRTLIFTVDCFLLPCGIVCFSRHTAQHISAVTSGCDDLYSLQVDVDP